MHVVGYILVLCQSAGKPLKDYDNAVSHQPSGKFPVSTAKQLGFKEPQIDTGLCVREIGNTYSGAIMVGLCAILDEAEAGRRLFPVGYGSGAGPDRLHPPRTDARTKIRRDAIPSNKDRIRDQV